MKTRVTISDVAAKAGVSKTTVSRYINGELKMMSEETADLIKEIIEELDYRPSRIAQNMKLKHTRVIGCVIADVTSFFSTYLVKGINDICEKNDYMVLFINTNNSPKKEVEAIKSLLDSQVDGLIINTTGGNDEYLQEVRKQGTPIVIADRYLEDEHSIDTITSQNYKATYECVEFLANQGYKHIYFVGQAIGSNKIRVIRQQAFIEAGQKYFKQFINPTDCLIVDQSLDCCLEDALNDIKRKHKDEPVALFAVNGMILLDLVVALKKSGYTVGKEFGLCGFDDWAWARLIEDGITTIRQDSYQIGVECAKRILHLIQKPKEKPRLVELETKLIIRGSTTIQ